MFAQVRQGIADGIHVDDFGNVWTGEFDLTWMAYAKVVTLTMSRGG